MMLFYIFTFILFGLIYLINSIYIFLNNKTFIYLPQLDKKNKSINSLQYQSYTQMLFGLLLLLYAITIYEFNIISILSHILFIFVSLTSICLLGHIKCLL